MCTIINTQLIYYFNFSILYNSASSYIFLPLFSLVEYAFPSSSFSAVSPSPSSSDYNTSNDDSLLDALLRPEVIGGVAGVAVLAAAAFFIVVIVCLKRRKRKKKEDHIYGLYYAASNTVYISHTPRAEQHSIHSTAGTGGTSTAINHSIMENICYFPPSFIQDFFSGGE